ncbi:hypothetical protein NMY22_g11079 [Coprinellus aureogranulatus]|nr:hypothetical protein NMY22_g11079 [Coprinellus aureogranulatus]
MLLLLPPVYEYIERSLHVSAPSSAQFPAPSSPSSTLQVRGQGEALVPPSLKPSQGKSPVSTPHKRGLSTSTKTNLVNSKASENESTSRSTSSSKPSGPITQATASKKTPETSWYVVTRGTVVGAVYKWSKTQSVTSGFPHQCQSKGLDYTDAVVNFLEAALDPDVKIDSETGRVLLIQAVARLNVVHAAGIFCNVQSHISGSSTFGVMMRHFKAFIRRESESEAVPLLVSFDMSYSLSASSPFQQNQWAWGEAPTEAASSGDLVVSSLAYTFSRVELGGGPEAQGTVSIAAPSFRDASMCEFGTYYELTERCTNPDRSLSHRFRPSLLDLSA